MGPAAGACRRPRLPNRSLLVRPVSVVLLVLVFVAVLALAAARPATANPQPVAPLPSVQNTDSAFGAVQALGFPSRAVEAGVRWERLIFPWDRMQPDGPDELRDGYFSMAQLDAQIARGISPVGILIYTPGWAALEPRHGPRAVPRNLALPYNHPDNYWGNFVTRVVSRYKGRVDSWIIWNEPDVWSGNQHVFWRGTIEEYFQLLKVAYMAAKSANPSSTVVMAGLTYWWDRENGRRQSLERLIELAKADPQGQANNYYFDVVNVHAYANPLNSYAVPETFRRVLRERGLDKPIWITESNVVPYDDPIAPLQPGGFRASMDEQASYVIQSIALARAAGVQRFSIYKLVDDVPEDGQYFGLVRKDGSVRPAYVAYQVAATYLSGVRSATYTWSGSSDPPTYDQVTALLRSNESRTQWVWPGAVNRVVLERARDRVTVVWNASSRPVTARIPARADVATLVDKYGRRSSLVPIDGHYELALEPSRNNSDPRDPTVYLVGGSPWIIVEAGEPAPARLPTSAVPPVTSATPSAHPSNVQPGQASTAGPSAVDARIDVVWPHGGASVEEAARANVTVSLFQTGTLEPASCGWRPTVRLWKAVDGEPARPVAVGQPRLAQMGGLSYPVWDFHEVDVSEATGGSTIYLFVTVDGVETHSSVWAHTSDGRRTFPRQDIPEGIGPADEVDARIQIVWPHDGAPVSEATLANVTVLLFQKGTWRSLPVEADPVVRLLAAVDNGPEHPVAVGVKEVVREGDTAYPRWVFNNVDVTPAGEGGRVYFRVTVDGVPTYSSVWAHAVDARTVLPSPDLPARGC